jgi:hypothetical protein
LVAVVDGGVMEVSSSVLHDKGCIKGKPQHKEEDETRLTQELIKRESRRRRNSDAAVLRWVLEQLRRTAVLHNLHKGNGSR